MISLSVAIMGPPCNPLPEGSSLDNSFDARVSAGVVISGYGHAFLGLY